MSLSQESLPVDALREIDALCDRFEGDWKAGKACRIEDYLPPVAGRERTQLLRSLLKLELEVLLQQGITPDQDTYLKRFPDCSAVVAEIFQESSGNDLSATISHSPFQSSEETEPPSGKAGPRGCPAIPGYEILEELGGGGMGVVYKARQHSLQRVVALKTIIRGGQAKHDLLVRFHREAEAVARLQHPHIVQIFEFGEADGVPYFTMEFVEGMDLRKALAGTPLPDRHAASLVETLARTMHTVHQQNIIHRDLKPANILLSVASGQLSGDRSRNERPPLTTDNWPLTTVPKISDFGLAKPLDDDSGHTATDAIIGTPSYMAPEQARGRRGGGVGPAADVYSLGAILYECLTGRPPFRAETPMDTVWQVLEQEPVPPRQLQPKLPADLETICLTCLLKDPRRRYGSAMELAEDLHRYATGVPIQARPVGVFERAWKWTRRHPALVGSVAAIFLALVVGIIGTSLGMIEAQRESERATAEEKKARQLLAESYAQTAQLASQRGRWRTALEQIEKAAQAGHPDSVALQVQKVKALIAVNDARAFSEIDRLAERDDLAEHEGAVRLLQGDITLIADNDKAVELLRLALARKLSEADRSYALGLMAETSPDAVRHFEKALEKDPFHQRAGTLLPLTLLFLGRLDEAHAHLSVAESLFPEDPNFKILRAMLLATRDDMKAARDLLERSRVQIGAKEYEAASAAVELVNLIHFVGQVTADDMSPLEKRLGRLYSLTSLISDYSRLARQETKAATRGLPLILPPAMMRSFGKIPSALSFGSLTGNSSQLFELLGQAARTHPEGTLHYLHGLYLFAERRMPEAEAAFVKAATTPAMAPVRRHALFHAVFCEGFLSSPNRPKIDMEMRKRSVVHMRQLLPLGPVRPQEAEILVKIARYSDEFVLARQVLADWERHEPNSYSFLRQKTLVELATGAYGPALEAARKMLSQRPNDAESRKYIQQAEAKLRELNHDSKKP